MRIGGAWCAGFWDPNRWMLGSPGPSITELDTWLQLKRDPLGRDFQVLRAYINQHIHDVTPGSEQKRAEVQLRVDQTVWGGTYTYQWRMIVPPNIVNPGPDVHVIVLQCHDENSPGIPRRPAFDIAYHDGKIEATLARTENPIGLDIWERAVSPGEEIEITLRAKWADGTHVPAASGVFELYDNGSLVYSLVGEKNVWDSGTPEERYPPFLKAGVYQPEPDESTWSGKEFFWYHAATIVSNEPDSPVSLRSIIDAELRQHPIRPLVPLLIRK
jgi:hypothetical protein